MRLSVHGCPWVFWTSGEDRLKTPKKWRKRQVITDGLTLSTTRPLPNHGPMLTGDGICLGASSSGTCSSHGPQPQHKLQRLHPSNNSLLNATPKWICDGYNYWTTRDYIPPQNGEMGMYVCVCALYICVYIYIHTHICEQSLIIRQTSSGKQFRQRVLTRQIPPFFQPDISAIPWFASIHHINEPSIIHDIRNLAQLPQPLPFPQGGAPQTL